MVFIFKVVSFGLWRERAYGMIGRADSLEIGGRVEI